MGARSPQNRLPRSNPLSAFLPPSRENKKNSLAPADDTQVGQVGRLQPPVQPGSHAGWWWRVGVGGRAHGVCGWRVWSNNWDARFRGCDNF